ncbi:MAG: hypothetical protein KDD67_07170 [Ignavibacteriae bacterium]|nr:hypothetical protein [Ignavibacteriota bacterium]MCB9215257.1 hypothetical protein [Ignavibacteria bacterium]
MKRNVIASLGAIAILFTAATITASAQTAGGSVLEQVSYLLKDSYTFGFNSKGSSLTLRSSATGQSGLVLEAVDGSVLMHIYLGNLSSMSKVGQEKAVEKIGFLNTTLPIGTLVIANGGDVMMEHHIPNAYAGPSGIAAMVGTIAAEAARQRLAIFG